MTGRGTSEGPAAGITRLQCLFSDARQNSGACDSQYWHMAAQGLLRLLRGCRKPTDAREDERGHRRWSHHGRGNQPPHRCESFGPRYAVEIGVRHKRVLASVVHYLNSLLSIPTRLPFRGGQLLRPALPPGTHTKSRQPTNPYQGMATGAIAKGTPPLL